ncbi:putative transcription factor MYB family [Helianthus anomalus]
MDHNGGSSLHTRSKAAPDWTVEESLILVNEVTAIEADCGDTLSSFQKWKIIVENCNALGVNRNLNHCRRKWDSLLSDYKKIKQSGSKKASFNSELFKGIESYVREFECGGYDTEADTDTDAPPAFVLQSDLLNQRAKMTAPQKHIVEVKSKPTRSLKSENNDIEECSSEQQVDHHTHRLNESKRFVEVSRLDHEHNIGEKLRENAEMIEAIVNNGNRANDLTRINGDKISICLDNLAAALDELCRLQTDSVV